VKSAYQQWQLLHGTKASASTERVNQKTLARPQGEKSSHRRPLARWGRTCATTGAVWIELARCISGQGTEIGPKSDTQMRSKSQAAWETAARCATLSEETDDPNEREYYARLRDAWITLAKRCEFSNISDVTDSEKF